MARRNVFGISPRYEDLDWAGASFDEDSFAQVMASDAPAWQVELALHEELFVRLAGLARRSFAPSRRIGRAPVTLGAFTRCARQNGAAQPPWHRSGCCVRVRATKRAHSETIAPISRRQRIAPVKSGKPLFVSTRRGASSLVKPAYASFAVGDVARRHGSRTDWCAYVRLRCRLRRRRLW